MNLAGITVDTLVVTLTPTIGAPGDNGTPALDNIVLADASSSLTAVKKSLGGDGSFDFTSSTLGGFSLTYFGRHQDGVSLGCPTRPSVASRVGSIARP